MLEPVWRKGNPPRCWWEYKLVQPLWEAVSENGKYDSAIPLLGIYLDKTIIQRDTCMLVFISMLFTIAKTWEQPNYPLPDDWIKRMWCAHTVQYYSAIKRQNHAICSNMGATGDDHTEWRNSERERQIPYDIIHIRNLKCDPNELIYETESWTERTDWCLPRGKGLRKGCSGRLWWADVRFHK